MPTPLFPRLDVGDVHLDDRPPERLERVADRPAVVRPGAGVEQQPVRVVGGLVQLLDELALVIGVEEARLEAELVPKGVADPRFAYRGRDVPAASHAPLAAAIAWLGGVREGDVVWDPFMGSGTELVERATRGPAAELVGTDLDPRALAAAEANPFSNIER